MPLQTGYANKVIDALLVGSTFPTYANFFGALFSTTLTLANSSTFTAEVTGASYLRTDITAAFSDGADGASANDAAIEFTSMPQTTVYAFAVVTSSSAGGQIVWQTTLTASKSVTAGDAVRLAIGALTATST
jgi:hypothetical protein